MHILPHSVSDVVSQEVTGVNHTADSLANLSGRAKQWEKSLCFPGGWGMREKILVNYAHKTFNTHLWECIWAPGSVCEFPVHTPGETTETV